MKPLELHFGSLDTFVEFSLAVVMRNERKSRLPTIGGGVILLDPRPGVGVNTSCLQQFKHQFVVMLEVLTF